MPANASKVSHGLILREESDVWRRVIGERQISGGRGGSAWGGKEGDCEM